MDDLPCHSRIRMQSGEGQFFCTHPRVHIRKSLVTLNICRGCKDRRLPPPTRFRSCPNTPHRYRERGNIQLVVARYGEDVSWLREYCCLSSIVYDKRDPSAHSRLPNVGREAHTYLHHILENYDRLADVTVFLQGDPHAHIPDLREKIWMLDRDVGYCDLCDHILVEDCRGEPIHPELRLDEMFESLFGTHGPDYYVCHSAACFAVSRDVIRQRPRAFYEKALNVVVNRPMGPWEIERLWQCIFQIKPATEGVVTAADAGFFRDLQLFVRSYQAPDRYPLVIFDLGMNAEQCRWCAEQPGVTVMQLPRIYRPVERIKGQHWWQAWLKPFYIYHAPLDRVLWIDADCVIVGDVAEAFALIDEHPLLVRDGTSAVTENDPSLYRYLTLPQGSLIEGVNVNAGVVGICRIRDRALLNAWAFASAWAAMHPEKRRLSAWADQGLLLWAVHRTGMADLIRQDLEWNYPSGSMPNLITAAVRNRRSILHEIRAQYPDASIVHWLGVHKLSQQLADELNRLFAVGFR